MTEPEPLDALWQRVVERWDDEARHAAFVEACRASGRLDLGARRYRALKDAELAAEEPALAGEEGRHDVASIDRRLSAIAALAMAQLGEPPRRAGTETRRSRPILVAVAVVMLLGALVLLGRALLL
ncbi:MAG: hypothetical protein HY744_14625 [Deltaproteobacteria bacterium]|nr:hypothetical protein [Deltaproteobacteria bacterium]